MIPYLLVILDEKGTIIDFQTTLEESRRGKEVIGQNWFDLFISPQDRAKVLKVFNEILQGKDHNYRTYKNDILCQNGRHRLIDFYNKLLTKDGKRYTFSVGVEHLDAQDIDLAQLAERLYASHPFF